MRLNGWGAISLGFLGLVIVISQGHEAQGKVSRANTNNQLHVIRKRNAWWSKKSTDEVNRIATGHSLRLQGKSYEDIKEGIDCYTQGCVPDFVWCGRHTPSDARFLQCKLEHRVCAARCFSRDGLSDGDM